MLMLLLSWSIPVSQFHECWRWERFTICIWCILSKITEVKPADSSCFEPISASWTPGGKSHGFQAPRLMWYTLTWIGLVYRVEPIGWTGDGFGCITSGRLRGFQDVKVPGISDFGWMNLDGLPNLTPLVPRDVFPYAFVSEPCVSVSHQREW